jgi:hypothetical protein
MLLNIILVFFLQYVDILDILQYLDYICNYALKA